MKTALFAFNGEPMCFVHVLLHALDLHAQGFQVAVVIEGTATKLVREYHDNPQAPFAGLYRQVKDQGLIAAVCRACAAKTGSLESAQGQGLPINGEMNGHPSLSRYLRDGWQVFTF